MPDLIWNDDADRLRGELRRPLLLLAFEGLFDAAEAATTALDSIRVNSRSTDIAEIDPEGFFNFQETRPTVSFDNDGERRISWPTTRVTVCQTDDARDLVVMTGIEPHMRWKTFADQIIDVARRTGAEMVVTVGAMVSMVPHTRPFAITGSSGDPELADRLGLDRPSYQGPTGVVGVINQRVGDMGIPIISLRVAVPHYVPGPPNPKAMQALLRRLEQTSGVSTGYEDLDSEVTQWMNRVDEAVKSDPESNDYVERLERQVDSDEEMLPTGDDLAAELEAFLREQKPSEDDSSSSEDPAGPAASDDPTAADDSGAGESGDGKSGEGTDSDSGSDGDSDSD
ncbi:MAG: PAC2 family protein [Acidimicrobiales bacterium]